MVSFAAAAAASALYITLCISVSRFVPTMVSTFECYGLPLNIAFFLRKRMMEFEKRSMGSD